MPHACSVADLGRSINAVHGVNENSFVEMQFPHAEVGEVSLDWLYRVEACPSHQSGTVCDAGRGRAQASSRSRRSTGQQHHRHQHHRNRHLRRGSAHHLGSPSIRGDSVGIPSRGCRRWCMCGARMGEEEEPTPQGSPCHTGPRGHRVRQPVPGRVAHCSRADRTCALHVAGRSRDALRVRGQWSGVLMPPSAKAVQGAVVRRRGVATLRRC
jgi:hypothetical protein